MRWLYRMIFLDKWREWLFGESKQTLSPPKKAEETLLYKTQVEYLVQYLQAQLQDKVYHSRGTNGRVIIGTVSDTIAELSIHRKGKSKNKMYVVVRLESEFEQYGIWFQLAFVAYHVSFGKPTLSLNKSRQIPRGH